MGSRGDAPAGEVANDSDLQNGDTAAVAPAPQQDCPANFGNTDMYGGSYLDPTQ